MVWTIYCHHHVDSGRRYIGLTKYTMMHRWNQHVAQTKSTNGYGHFRNAIRKYGKDAFSHHVIQKLETLEEAGVWETFWIEFFDTRNPSKGFNIARGGFHSPESPLEAKQKLSEANKKRWQDPCYRINTLAALKASLNTQESRTKRIASSKEALNRPEVLAKMARVNDGRVVKPETIEKIRLAGTGKSPKSETRQAIKQKMTRNWNDPEYLDMMELDHFAHEKVCKHHGLQPRSSYYETKRKSGRVNLVCKECSSERSAKKWADSH